jgi:hypothetical protein
MSAASSSATRSGSSECRIDSSAAIGTSMERRSSASCSTVAQGCSTYSRLPTASRVLMAMRASSTDQAPFASTRTRPDGPTASRTASTRNRSSASTCPRSATFTLAVEHPDRRTMSAACSGPTAGTVQLTGIRSRTGSGHGRSAESTAAASHGTQAASSYPMNGLNSAHPASPCTTMPSRRLMPRNRVGIAIAKVLNCTPCTLVLGA